MASLCHPWFTTTNLSYRFPIFETSATALCGTTGSVFIISYSCVKLCECQLHPPKTLCPASDEVGTLSKASESKWQEWTVGAVELQWLLTSSACAGLCATGLCFSHKIHKCNCLSPCYVRLKQPRLSCSDQRSCGPRECWKQFRHRDYRCLEGDLVFLSKHIRWYSESIVLKIKQHMQHFR